jgi:hypothetical protein
MDTARDKICVDISSDSCNDKGGQHGHIITRFPGKSAGIRNRYNKNSLDPETFVNSGEPVGRPLPTFLFQLRLFEHLALQNSDGFASDKGAIVC